MNRDRIISAALAAAVAVGVVVLVRDEDLGKRPIDARIHHKGESKLLELPDGGKGYSYPTTLEDGGTEYLVTDVAPCVRAPADGGECLRLLDDGGAAFFGALNRFPREQAVGASCEPVACSVVAGENADEDEDAHLERERKQRSP